MKRIIAYCILLFPLIAFANEAALLEDAVELYKYEDPFGKDVALLYRPSNNPAGLAIFDLTDSVITIIKHGPPQNCMELIISSAGGGAIFAGCIKPVDIDKALGE